MFRLTGGWLTTVLMLLPRNVFANALRMRNMLSCLHKFTCFCTLHQPFGSSTCVVWRLSVASHRVPTPHTTACNRLELYYLPTPQPGGHKQMPALCDQLCTSWLSRPCICLHHPCVAAPPLQRRCLSPPCFPTWRLDAFWLRKPLLCSRPLSRRRALHSITTVPCSEARGIPMGGSGIGGQLPGLESLARQNLCSGLGCH